MAKHVKSDAAETEAAREKLRSMYPPDSYVYVTMRGNAATVLYPEPDHNGRPGIRDITGLVLKALPEFRMSRKPGAWGIVISNPPTRASFHLAYSLSYALYPRPAAGIASECVLHDVAL